VNEKEEGFYEQGSRAAWASMLRECVKQLDYKSDEGSKAAWISEREAAVAMLRQVCAEFGDNDWPDDLHLADVIETHLWRNLESEADQPGEKQ
jgi:hypothetical protein